MADPVTMAVVGGSVGAMMNKKDPLKGALLGAAGGYGGATLMGAGGAGIAPGIIPSSSALSGSTTINAAALPTNAVQAFTTGAPMATPLNVEAMKTAGGGLFSGGMANPAPFVSSGTSTGMIPSSLYEPTMMDKFASVGQYAQQNPVLTQMAMQTANQAMQQPPEQPLAPGQINRSQIQGGDYASLLNPQQGTVLRPQPISLLG